ncbi:Hypothetical predicted protein [Podarcis lilfordi]|uniref:Uncharacterized protein n=1 Tax=Podarcis lilfordi TaxID=74358 RepID=A0AA35PD87_9SAUR|nr:Hypothetical predicted protein [Podarcis lilfordi]
MMLMLPSQSKTFHIPFFLDSQKFKGQVRLCGKRQRRVCFWEGESLKHSLLKQAPSQIVQHVLKQQLYKFAMD